MDKLNTEQSIMYLLGIATTELSGKTIRAICQLSGGSVYVTLDRLEDKGLIVSCKRESQSRVYKRAKTLAA